MTDDEKREGVELARRLLDLIQKGRIQNPSEPGQYGNVDTLKMTLEQFVRENDGRPAESYRD